MADTIANVPLVADTWTELYTATGIAAGTSLLMQNLSSNGIYLHAGADIPVEGVDGFKILPGYREAVNETGDTGAWVISRVVGGLVNVTEA